MLALTDARLNANRANAQASTGPRTPEGKAKSATNAIRFGLFSGRDYVRPGEEELYHEFRAGLFASLSAAEPLEETLAAEIVRAAWRLRRCSEIEASFTDEFDPMENGWERVTQEAVDRARSQATRLMHRNIAELRRVQTERQARAHLIPVEAALPEAAADTGGLASTQEVHKVVSLIARRNALVGPKPGPATRHDARVESPFEPEFTNRTHSAAGAAPEPSPQPLPDALKQAV